MTREEPRPRDWWLVGCASLAAVLIAVDVAAVLSDDGVAGSAGEPQVQTATLSAFRDVPVQVPASEAPASLAERTARRDCAGAIARSLPAGSPDTAATVLRASPVRNCAPATAV